MEEEKPNIICLGSCFLWILRSPDFARHFPSKSTVQLKLHLLLGFQLGACVSTLYNLGSLGSMPQTGVSQHSLLLSHSRKKQ